MNRSEAHRNLLQEATERHQQGLLGAAEDLYRQLVRDDPLHFDALNRLAIVALQRGDLQEALSRVELALRARPDSASAISNKGTILASLKRYDEALAAYDRVIQINPGDPDTHFNRANTLKEMHRHLEALESYDKAIAMGPSDADVYSNRGSTLFALERLEEAVSSFNQAIALEPRSAFYFNRGKALNDLKRFDEAVASYDRALEAKADFAEAFYNRGNALAELMRLDAAVTSYDRAIALEPRGEFYCNRGRVLNELKRPNEAVASYDQAIAIKPDFTEALFNRGLTALLMGDFHSGWNGYEYRFDCKGARKRNLIAPYPTWNGEPLHGKRIVVYEEQGLGDTIQFSRYLHLLSSMGAQVTFLVRTSLHRLLQPFAPKVRLMEKHPPLEGFDFQCALLSLPSAFRTAPDTIPSTIPYLFPEAELVAFWRQRLGHDGLKVGIAWQGDPNGEVDVGRSIPLRCFQPVAAIPGVRLISLQKHHGLEQLSSLHAKSLVETFGAELDSGPDAFIDTAAIMACLDLVITSDTSIAHLAGALGCPVWLVVKHVPEWRWMLDRSDSPWYRTMKIYRQTERNDWGGAFNQVAADLLRFRDAIS
jgi:tetratricopeptide (TPR) repeat protein